VVIAKFLFYQISFFCDRKRFATTKVPDWLVMLLTVVFNQYHSPIYLNAKIKGEHPFVPARTKPFLGLVLNAVPREDVFNLIFSVTGWGAVWAASAKILNAGKGRFPFVPIATTKVNLTECVYRKSPDQFNALIAKQSEIFIGLNFSAFGAGDAVNKCIVSLSYPMTLRTFPISRMSCSFWKRAKPFIATLAGYLVIVFRKFDVFRAVRTARAVIQTGISCLPDMLAITLPFGFINSKLNHRPKPIVAAIIGKFMVIVRLYSEFFISTGRATCFSVNVISGQLLKWAVQLANNSYLGVVIDVLRFGVVKHVAVDLAGGI